MGYFSSGSINAVTCVRETCILSTLGGRWVVSSDGMMCTLGYEGRLHCFVGIGTLGVTYDSSFLSDDFSLFCDLLVEAVKMTDNLFSA